VYLIIIDPYPYPYRYHYHYHYQKRLFFKWYIRTTTKKYFF
jgi:hypothetical protein